jgi:peroxiredoxin Q/BCP
MSELKEGNKCPDFSMDANDGKNYSLQSLAGQKFVLYFYPKDDTPGCSIEAKQFNDSLLKFQELKYHIIGVSKDNLKSHDKFAQKFCLTFPLATDDKGVCEAFGIWVEKSMYGKKYFGIDRATFVIDEKGVIKKVWYKVKAEGHANEVLDFVKSM